MKHRCPIALLLAIVANAAVAQNTGPPAQSDTRDAAAAFIATQHYIVGRIGTDCLSAVGREESPSEFEQKWKDDNASYLDAATKYEAARLDEIYDPAERENAEASYKTTVQGPGELAVKQLLSDRPKDEACKFALEMVDTGSMHIEEYARTAKLPIMKNLIELVEWAKTN